MLYGMKCKIYMKQVLNNPKLYQEQFMIQDGNLLRTTRYYSQENLPINILTKLQKRYAGKSVYGVTELSTEDGVSYHITMQDEKNWYIIRIR